MDKCETLKQKGIYIDPKFDALFEPQKEKSPQVVIDLTGSTQIVSNQSIPQNELIEILCDADLAASNYAVTVLRRLSTIDKVVGVNNETNT